MEDSSPISLDQRRAARESAAKPPAPIIPAVIVSYGVAHGAPLAELEIEDASGFLPSRSLGLRDLSLPERGNESSPTQRHMIDLRINGRGHGGGIADNDLLNALTRLSVDCQSSAAGRMPSWVK
jgi:hypothetical protein